MSMKEKTTGALKAMLNKNSGADQTTVKKALAELKRRGEDTPPPALVMGGRAIDNPKAPPPRPKRKTKMAKGGYANCGASSPATQDSTKKMAVGGMAKKAVPSGNTGLAKLPKDVRNKMGYMAYGGYAKKK